jgi:hypothetical protein
MRIVAVATSAGKLRAVHSPRDNSMSRFMTAVRIG